MTIISVFDARTQDQALFFLPEEMSKRRAEYLMQRVEQEFDSLLEDDALEFLSEFGIGRFFVYADITIGA